MRFAGCKAFEHVDIQVEHGPCEILIQMRRVPQMLRAVGMQRQLLHIHQLPARVVSQDCSALGIHLGNVIVAVLGRLLRITI